MAGFIVVVVIAGFIGLYAWAMAWSRRVIAEAEGGTIITTSLSAGEAFDLAQKTLKGPVRLGVVQKRGQSLAREFRSVGDSMARLQVDVDSIADGKTMLRCAITDAEWTSRGGIKQVGAITKAKGAVGAIEKAIRKRDAGVAVRAA